MNFLKATITVDLNPLGRVCWPVWRTLKQTEELAAWRTVVSRAQDSGD
jgi:hypothetical protein